MLKDRSTNAICVPADTTCASWKSWEGIKAERERAATNDDMEARHKGETQGEDTRQEDTAPSCSQIYVASDVGTVGIRIVQHTDK